MQIGDFGFWDSSISAEKVAAGSVSTTQMEVDGEELYWDEMRPLNQGRTTLVFISKEGKKSDATEEDFNCRTAVHEMGGGAFVVHQGTIYANNFKDKNLYVKTPGRAWKILTTGCRFADMRVTKHGIIAVAEYHEEGKEAHNFLALIDPVTGKYRPIATGYDFYASPSISADGKKIAWVCWNHPNMPWYDTELWIADIDDNGDIIHASKVAGDIPEAIVQPQWSQEGILYFVSDRDEWWNLYQFDGKEVSKTFSVEGEIGSPPWLFRYSNWCFLGDKILFTYYFKGVWKLSLYDPKSKNIQAVPGEGNCFRQLRAGKNCAFYIEEFAEKPGRIVKIDASTLEQKVIKVETTPFSPSDLSTPKHVEYPSAGGRMCYGFYYPPKSGSYIAPEGQKPPLVVTIHGGPHGMAFPTYSLGKQYWTNRGFAVLDVNYGGSTGYGRTYRFALHGTWGVVDVEDCIYGARFLVDQGLVDPQALFIRGGSAGGFTTLAALAFDTTFKAGASYYGVADLMALAHDTHKFESRYLDSLLGPLPETEALWKERSPLSHTDSFNAPLIIFQGTEDKIVPPNQSVMIYEALKKRGIPTEIYLYEGEQHGFRKKETIIDSLDKELNFYRKLLQDR